ncbi:hypothetical protein EMCRGX_G003823 [Ephydatia muelleri]
MSLSCRFIASSRSSADCVMLAGPYPNTLKRLVSVQECVDQSSHLPLYASGDRQVFAQVGNVAAEAVNYFDGDGDSIRCGPIPVPSPLPPSEWYSHSLRVQSQVCTTVITVPTCLLKCTPATRRQTSLCRLNLVCHGVHRGDGGDRIVVEVVTRDVTSSTFLVSGLSRVQCGFSFPVPNALRQYDVAMEAAVAAHCGVLEIGPSMAAQEAMPWSLKGGLFIWASHLPIHTSFIRPCPNATIPRGAYICHFAIGQPPSTAPPSDYELSSTRRGSLLVYDPQVYDGHNIGRFVNKGGLLEGLRELVATLDRDRGCTTYSPTVAEAIFD